MGFKELMTDSITEMFTYRTTKLVKTNDRFLVTLHFIFMSLIGTFALVSILLSHNYMVFELPSLYTNLGYKNYGDIVTVNEAYNQQIAKNSTEAYCKTGYVNWRRSNKIFDDTFMAGVDCVSHYRPEEYVWPFEDGRGLRIGTFEEVIRLTRTCANTAASTITDADCTTGTVASTHRNMIAGADIMTIPFSIRFQLRKGSLDDVDYVYIDGEEISVMDTDPTTTPTKLLQMAGINSLDEANSYIVGYRGSVTGLPYRLSGIRLNVKVVFANTYFTKPLKSTKIATLSVEQVPADFFNQKKTVEYHRTSNGADYEKERVIHTWSTMTIAFVPSGAIGQFDLFALALAITNAFVLIGMATTIVDFVGVMSSETFLDDKYEDDGERLGLEMMLANIEGDDHPGVPFDPNDLRLKDASGQQGLSYEKTLEQLLEEVREIQEQFSLLPENEAELRAITTGKAEPDEYRKLRLVYIPDPLSTEANDKKYVPPEIMLHDGMQTIGRGMGGVDNKGVSRQQFSIAVVKERIRTKSLHEGPGIWRQSTGCWQSLQVGKSAVLSVGDRLCFRMREGKMGGHEGVFALDYQDSRAECTVFGIPFR